MPIFLAWVRTWSTGSVARRPRPSTDPSRPLLRVAVCNTESHCASPAWEAAPVVVIGSRLCAPSFRQPRIRVDVVRRTPALRRSRPPASIPGTGPRAPARRRCRPRRARTRAGCRRAASRAPPARRGGSPRRGKATTHGSRIQPPRHRRLRDPLDGQAVGGHPHAHVPRLVDAARSRRTLLSTISLSLRVDLVLLPEVLLEPLHPLEVGDDDAAGIGEHVREATSTPLSSRISSAAGVVGPFAPSQMTFALTRSAFSSFITCSRLQGARMSQSSRRRSSFEIALPRRRGPASVPRSCLCAIAAVDVDPVRVVEAAARVRDRRSASRPPPCMNRA